MRNWIFAILMFAPIFANAAVVIRPASEDDGKPARSEMAPHELLPQLRPDLTECAKKDGREVRALTVGINHYPDIPFHLNGAENDANLISSVLTKRAVTVTKLIGDVTRASFVKALMTQADKSRCGDTLFVYFSGVELPGEMGHGYQFLFADANIKVDAVKKRMEGSQRSRWVVPGAVDSAEMADFIERVRTNGVNVVFIADTCNSKQFASIASFRGPDFWHWDSTFEELGGGSSTLAGAYFGVYAGAIAVEKMLPPGDKAAKTHGLLTWAMATAMADDEHPTFRAFANAVKEQVSKQVDAPTFAQVAPVFEATHADRYFLATGLPSEDRTGVRLRGNTPTKIQITNPLMPRGIGRVSEASLLIEGRVQGDRAPKVIEANQVPGTVNPDGTFKVKLPLQRGENKVTVVAWWGDSDFDLQRFSVLSQDGDQVVQQGKQYAVLIANQNYQDSTYAQLETPIADSHELAQILTNRYGMKTSVRIGDRDVSLVMDNAKRSDIMGLLNKLRAVVGKDDSLLIYYAGHGEYEKITNNANWLPVDAKADDPDGWITDKSISDAISRMNVRHVLIVADSCYAGAFKSRGEGDAISKADMSRIQFLDQANTRPSRMFISSGANEPVADGGGGGHSVFARALLSGLTLEAKPITAGELFTQHIKAKVSGASKQMPQYFPLKDGHDGGEFVFVPREIR